jgi:hypothetical protein
MSWCTKKQPRVALSSAEAEYIALCACVYEACWFCHILIELGVVEDINLCVSIFEDSQSAIKISRSYEQPKRLKHVDIKYHFFQEKVQDGFVKIMYINAADQLADILTKPLGKIVFETLKGNMFVCY